MRLWVEDDSNFKNLGTSRFKVQEPKIQREGALN